MCFPKTFTCGAIAVWLGFTPCPIVLPLFSFVGKIPFPRYFNRAGFAARRKTTMRRRPMKQINRFSLFALTAAFT